MKIVIISDTHCQLDKVEVPEGDVLIHCGDWTYRGSRNEIRNFGKHIKLLNHKYKFLVPGNHDLSLDSFHSNYNSAAVSWLKLKLPNERVLINSIVVIDGFTIFFTPMILKVGDWAFGWSDYIKQKIYDTASKDKIDMVVSHGPPQGILDEDAHYGCPVLKEFIKKVKPKYHVFGHCHGDYGQTEIDGTTYINASICNMNYKPMNKPIVIEV